MRVHLRLEEPYGSATFRLGAIKCGVGVTDNGHRVSAVGREYRNSDARSVTQALAVNDKVIREFGDQPLCKHFRARRLRPGRHDREFIAAESSHECPIGCGLKAPRNFLQEPVSDKMAIGVVDFLETIEVEAEDGEHLIVGGGMLDGKFQVFGE